jgi:hypothetical protein
LGEAGELCKQQERERSRTDFFTHGAYAITDF